MENIKFQKQIVTQNSETSWSTLFRETFSFLISYLNFLLIIISYLFVKKVIIESTYIYFWLLLDYKCM